MQKPEITELFSSTLKNTYNNKSKSKGSYTPILAFAPMEPYTANPIIRELCGWNGAQILYRPKILPQHLLKAKKWQSWQKIKNIQKIMTINDKPIYDGIQLIARIDDPIKPAIEFINHHSREMGIQFIDLNFSCPGYKVLPKGRGGELLRQPDQVLKIIEKVLKYAEMPISLKIRKGYNPTDNPLSLCKQIVTEFGTNIEFIAVNRAPVRMGNINPEKIVLDNTPFRDAVNAVDYKIPIIANGDIHNMEEAKKVCNSTGCLGAMIGRSALGNPAVFHLHNKFNIDTITEKNLQKFFEVYHKYSKGASGRWCTLGNLKSQFYFFIKDYLDEKKRQPPMGYGFNKWNATNFTNESFIDALRAIFTMIPKNNWENWTNMILSTVQHQTNRQKV